MINVKVAWIAEKWGQGLIMITKSQLKQQQQKLNHIIINASFVVFLHLVVSIQESHEVIRFEKIHRFGVDFE